MKPHHFAEVGAVVLACEGAFAVTHRLLGLPYAGFTPTYASAMDTSLAVVWLAGAIAMLLHRTALAFVVAMFSMLASFVHGLMFSITSREGYGIPFLVAAVLVLYALFNAAPAWHETRASMATRRPRHV